MSKGESERSSSRRLPVHATAKLRRAWFDGASWCALAMLPSLFAASVVAADSRDAATPAIAVPQLSAPWILRPPLVEATGPGQIRRELQPCDEGALLIRSQFTPSSAAASGPVSIADWTFHVREPKSSTPFARLEYRTEQWYGSTFWSGPDWTRVGRDWHHPGEQTPSIRCFESPRDGLATISGRVRKLHLDGDGIRAYILQGDREIWRAEIDGKDAEGVEPRLQVSLKKGECLRFVVHKRGQIFCDTTYWDPVVTWADGAASKASDSFTPAQGTDGWFYEMASQAAVPVAPVTVYAWGHDLTQREFLPGKEGIDLNGDELLPLFVLFDPASKSGVLIGLDAKSQWACRVELSDAGDLRWTTRAPIGVPPANAADVPLPTMAIVPLREPWTNCISTISSWFLGDKSPGPLPEAVMAVRSAVARVAAVNPDVPDVDLFLLVQSEWRLEDGLTDEVNAYERAVREHLKRTSALLADPSLSDSLRQQGQAVMAELLASCDRGGQQLPAWRELYVRTRLLKRSILFQHPRMRFPELLFCKRVPPSYSHLVGQYYGWRQRAGGGLFVLSAPGKSLRCRSILGESLPPGSVLEPRLSYDARRIIFSFVECRSQGYDPLQLVPNEEGADEGYFHIWEVGCDGSGLRQLTRGTYDDMMPIYLPDGDIVFASTRRRSYSRCFGTQFSKRWDSYTLYRMAADGSNLRQLSANDVSEWFPAVSNHGHLLFARWDYIDRDAVTHQNLWSSRPDGTNPAAVWGNATPKPHCTFQAQAVPDSNKIVFIASAHHAITAGPVCVVDPDIDVNSESALVRVTPVPFPEAESSEINEYYNSPWPLSDSLFLVAYSRDRLRFEGEHLSNPNPDNSLGLYLLDAAGNRELIYRDPHIGSTTPIPLCPKRTPPIVASSLARSEEAVGEMMVADIYEGLGDIPRGSIKQIRVVQIFPKTTPLANLPQIGIAGEENARAILGTVPVEADGSARFIIPSDRPVLFQALDENGDAYQTMRSTTYVQRGERIGCVGCHEPRMSTLSPSRRLPLAFQREPSQLDPGELGGRPFSFVEMIQPVLDEHCVRCHGGERVDGNINLTGAPHQGFTRSYLALCGDPAGTAAAKSEGILVPRYAQRNQVQVTTPGGANGARGSRLLKILRQGHEQVIVPDRDLRKLSAWIDMNATFYGAYLAEDVERQLRGEPIAMPAIQ